MKNVASGMVADGKYWTIDELEGKSLGGDEGCAEELEGAKDKLAAINGIFGGVAVGAPYAINAVTSGNTEMRLRFRFGGFAEGSEGSGHFIFGTRTAASTDGYDLFVNQHSDSFELRLDYGSISNKRATGLTIGEWYTVIYKPGDGVMTISIEDDRGDVVYVAHTDLDVFSENGTRFGIGNIIKHSDAQPAPTADMDLKLGYLWLKNGEDVMLYTGEAGEAGEAGDPLEDEYGKKVGVATSTDGMGSTYDLRLKDGKLNVMYSYGDGMPEEVRLPHSFDIDGEYVEIDDELEDVVSTTWEDTPRIQYGYYYFRVYFVGY